MIRRDGRCTRGVRTDLVELVIVAMVMMRHRRRCDLGIGTGDDRHRAMLERRHESGRTKKAQSKQQCKQRCGDRARECRKAIHSGHRPALAPHYSRVSTKRDNLIRRAPRGETRLREPHC